MALPGTRTRIDPLDEGAVAAMSELHAAAFHRAWSEHEFASLLASPHVTAWGLWRRGWFGMARLAGFLMIRTVEDEAEVLSIVVASDLRGRGYGRLLMDEALRALYRDRVAACFLEVDRDNTAAVSLYRSLGFENAGERKGYYAGGGTALVMRARLS